MSEQAVRKRKVMQFIACEAGRDRAAFREHYLRHHAPLVLLHCRVCGVTSSTWST